MYQLDNVFYGELDLSGGDITSGATAITLDAGDVARLGKTPTATDPMLFTIWDRAYEHAGAARKAGGKWEIISVTAKDAGTDTLTAGTRGFSNSTAQSYNAADNTTYGIVQVSADEVFAQFPVTESGIWTPTVPQGISSVSTDANTAGTYWKSDDFVAVQFRLGVDGGSATADELRIGGLPFTAGANLEDRGAISIALGTSGFANSATTNDPYLFVENSQTYIRFFNGDGSGSFTGNSLNNAGSFTLYAGGFYII